MATYDEIYGKRVEVLDADPTLNSTYEGQVWFNSVSGTLKTVTSFAAYSSSSPMNTKRRQGNGFGAVGSFNIAGGEDGVAGGETHHESYNGTGWTTLTSMPVKNASGGGAGTTTAGLTFGGNEPPGNTITSESYEWNGSAWTGGGAMSQARRYLGCGTGSQTSALAMGGGYPPPTGVTANTSGESYNGTSWSGETALPAKRRSGAYGLGATETAAMQIAGNSADAPPNTLTQEVFIYDGSAWSAIGSLSGIARQASASAGTTTAALVVGGDNASTVNALSEQYDGTSWTTASNLSTARDWLSGPVGPGSSAPTSVFAGGNDGTANVAVTEEYNFSINTITPGAWASGGALNQGRYWLGSANQAPSSAALGFAGYLTPGNTMYTLTEEYDGTSWTEKADLALARSKVGGAGTSTAALCIGGYVNAVGTKSEVEEFNGSSWSEETNIGTARYAGGAGGTQTAAVYMSGVFYTAGSGPSLAYKAQTEEYDGSSWSESGDVSTARGLCAGCGTQTAALIVGGLSPSYSNATEEYNGSSWTTGGTYPTTMAQFAGAGSQTSALAFGGTAPTPGTGSVLTFNYDGSAWSTQPSLPSGKRGMGGTGSTSAGLSFGGATNLATTEEFTGETSTVTSKTLTTG